MSSTDNQVSPIDEGYLGAIRENVSRFISECARLHDREESLLLDIAPQDHEGAAAHFKKSKVETLDIDSESGATYIADLCRNNQRLIPSGRYDFIVCTEVLEHTLQPFDAAREIGRLLSVGGLAFVSTPFNFRIHGPLPDCWRFTEHGLRALFHDFNITQLNALESERFLAPIHYTLVAKKEAKA